MWHRLLAVVIKEIRSYLRDPATRSLVLGAPVLQVTLFSLAASLDVGNVDVAVLNQDQGRWSHELIARIDGASFTDAIVPVHSLPELSELIAQRRALVGVHIAADFSRKLTAAKEARVQLLVDGRRANAGQVTANYFGAIVEDLNVELIAAGEELGKAPQVRLRHWFNPNLNYRWFMVVNICAGITMLLTLVVTALSIAREREMGTFDQLLVAPLNSIEIIIAKSVPGLTAGGVASILVGLLAAFGFGVPFTGNLLAHLFCTLLFLLSVVGFGLVISSLCQTQQQAVLGTFFGATPFVLTGGFMTPVENMPDWLQLATELNPFKHYLQAVQGSFFRAQSFAQLWPNMWPLALIAAATLLIATLVVRRSLR